MICTEVNYLKVRWSSSEASVIGARESEIRALRHRLETAFRNGRVHGIASALELFYERR